MNSIIRSIASAVVLLAISSATASPPAGVSIELDSPHGEPSDHVVWRRGPDVFACRCCEAEPQPGRDDLNTTGGTIPPVDGPIVRVAYLIPTNRTPQARGVQTLQTAVRWWHVWFHGEMARYDFEPKSFRYETEPDGVTPRIHVVDVPATDDELRSNPWGAVLDAASAGGVPVWATGQIWLLVPEMHVQQPNGAIEGGVALGGSFGSGLDPGVAVLGSNGLAMMRAAFLTSNLPYHGHLVPEIGPYPLVQDVSFAWFEGSTFSSVSSSYLGAGAHELTHAFGIHHDVRNDQNFHGNMMGNGLRGFRGGAFPADYLSDAMRLSYAHALALSTSRYFITDLAPVENVKPNLSVPTGGAVTPVDGHLVIEFTASDASGLAAALLQLNGNTVGELLLSGTSVAESFQTPYYTAGTANQYRVVVYDVHGNRRDVDRTITPSAGSNAAPRAEFRVIPPTALPGQTVTLDAGLTHDPDHPSSALLVEWDLNGDGNYDTDPTTTKTLSLVKNEPGIDRIGLRVTDPLGAQSESSPIPLLVRQPGDIDGHGAVDGLDLLHILGTWGTCPPMPMVCPADLTPSEFGDGDVDGLDLLLILMNWG